MSRHRLSAAMEATAIVRACEANGDFATILRKGDSERGALLLVIRSRERHVTCLERMLSSDGAYRWERAGPAEPVDPKQLAEFLNVRVRFDEDLWLIELDIAQPERFIAETTSAG